MKKNASSLLMAGLVALSALLGGAAHAAAPYAHATVEGALAPGVYGRIEIGNAPPPPLVYRQPMLIQRAPVHVQQPPLYLHVPPGHAKKWSKHCARYHACNRRVFFVKVQGDEGYERRHGPGPHRGYDNDRGNRHDHGPGPGKGHGGGPGGNHGNGQGRGHDRE